MSDRRVYLPLSGAELEAIAGPHAAIEPATAYAVTERLRRADPGADEEQLEYAAFLAAAAEASRRRDGARTRRIVAAADLDAASVLDADDADLDLVRLRAPVTRSALVSLHVDEHPAGEDALLWYDVTELSWVLAQPG